MTTTAETTSAPIPPQLLSLSLFFLPKDLIATCQLPTTVKHDHSARNIPPVAEIPSVISDTGSVPPTLDAASASTSAFEQTSVEPRIQVIPSIPTTPPCRICNIPQLESVKEQREHVRSGWHRYNLKQQLLDKSALPVPEHFFEELFAAELTKSRLAIARKKKLDGLTSKQGRRRAKGGQCARHREMSNESIGASDDNNNEMQDCNDASDDNDEIQDCNDTNEDNNDTGCDINDTNNDSLDTDEYVDAGNDGNEMVENNDKNDNNDGPNDVDNVNDNNDNDNKTLDKNETENVLQALFRHLEDTIREREQQARRLSPSFIQKQKVLDRQREKLRMSPMLWFTNTTHYGTTTLRLGIYKNALVNRGQCDHPLEYLASVQIPVPPILPRKPRVKRAERARLLLEKEKEKEQEQEQARIQKALLEDGETQSQEQGHNENKQENQPFDESLSTPLLPPLPAPQNLPSMPPPRYWTLFLLGGGHFAGMVVDLRGQVKRQSRIREMKIEVHKTFRRYTVRKKNGGSQSSLGVANSAGARIRMHNETALKLEVRQLLESWSEWIEQSECIFMHAPGNNRRTVLYDGSVIQAAERDGRLRSIPFVTRRPTFAEVKRCYLELISVKVSTLSQEELDALEEAQALALEEATAEQNADEEYEGGDCSDVYEDDDEDVKVSKELDRDENENENEDEDEDEENDANDDEDDQIDENVKDLEIGQETLTDIDSSTPKALSPFTQSEATLRLVRLVRKGRAEALSRRLLRFNINPSRLLPAHFSKKEYDFHRTPTLLHLASHHGQASVVQVLLEKHDADPTVTSFGWLQRSSAIHCSNEGETATTTTTNTAIVAALVSTLTAYEVARDKETRNVFRRAMAQMPDRWEWRLHARVPSPLTPEMEMKSREKWRKQSQLVRERVKNARERSTRPSWVSTE
ncbi:hypothetical protein BGZ94_007526 [Podila epigama]|nr:hypothetical protein BGZ94_007526 [Podila epigama]